MMGQIGLDGTADSSERVAAEACAAVGNDRHRLLDILLTMQERCRWISPAAMDQVADCPGPDAASPSRGVASFYSFLSLEPKGRVTIRLCDDIVDRYAGYDAVLAAFEDELGIRLGRDLGGRRLLAGTDALHRHVRPGAGGDGQRRRRSPV